jgi:hypothetical protein
MHACMASKYVTASYMRPAVNSKQCVVKAWPRGDNNMIK